MKRLIEGKDGAMIAVEDVGEGQPLLFVHGWPFNQKMFEYQYSYFLPRGFRVVGIDLRGFGNSDLVIEDYSYDTFADDIKAVVDSLKIRDATLIGFQMGGAVAARYLARHGSYGISKLILISAAAPILPKRPIYLHGLKKSQLTDLVNQIQLDRPKMIQEFVNKLFQAKVYAAYKNWLGSLALDASSYAMILSLLALRDEDVGKDLVEITVPTLICHGERDQVCPVEMTAEMSTLIPQNLVMLFRKSGHAIFHDETEKLNTVMHKFIQNRSSY